MTTWRTVLLTLALAAGPAPAQDASAPPPARATPAATNTTVDGRTVDGHTVDWQQLRGKSVLVAFFSLRMQGALDCLRVYETLHGERGAANLEVLGVCIDQDRGAELRALLVEHALTFPVLLDADGQLRATYQPQSMPHAYFFAEQGRYLGDLPGFPDSGSPTPAAFYANLLRRAVGLEVAIDNDPNTTPWPPMPTFAIPGGEVDSDHLRGKPYVFMFVAPECDRCRAQLELFRTLQPEFAATPLQWVCVLVGDGDPRAFAAERRLPFPVFADPDGSLRRTLRYRGLVPDTFLVDAAGRIRYRHVVFDDEQPPLYRMELRALLGQPNPPILKPNGPSGVRRCAVCHDREYFDWRATGHAHAMRSLQAIGKAEEPDCVRCHVVGWQQPGGYDADQGARAEWLADVQCESCHGNGGPHLQPRSGPTRVAATSCASCHDEKHSLGFAFERFVHLVDHRADLRTAPPEQRAAAARRRAEERRALLEPEGAYVGAAACLQCHPAQFANWAASPHATAIARLPADRRTDAQCVRCHTTGVGRTWADGSEPDAAAAATHGVQCESCHGPGQRHVTAAAEARRATILGLGERCEECVLRQLCTNCHDQQNDADFEFARALAVVRTRCRPPPQPR